jgi:hypothetical protein
MLKCGGRMAHNRKIRLHERRSLALGLVRRILQRVVSGGLDAHEGYRQVETIYLDNRELLEELNPVVALLGTEAGDEQMIASAKEWLQRHASEA